MEQIYCFKLEKVFKCVWGARAIYNAKHGEIEFVPDRFEIKRKDNFVPLKNWLSKIGLDAIKKLIKTKRLREDSNEVLIFKDDNYIIKATPNGSYGYMYIAAHPFEELTLKEEMELKE